MFDTLAKEIANIRRKDPACNSVWDILFCYPGFHAVMWHRLFHYLWTKKFFLIDDLVKLVVKFAASLIRITTHIEIHPAARIGERFFIDHGHGVVIGETAIIGNNVTLYQGVTIGGVSTRKEKRHPTLGSNIIVGAGAKVLGNIEVGDYVQVGANSVVVKDIPSYSTVVGIPGRIVKMNGEMAEAIENLEHHKTPDYVGSVLKALTERIEELEAKLESKVDANKA